MEGKIVESMKKNICFKSFLLNFNQQGNRRRPSSTSRRPSSYGASTSGLSGHIV
jgi:hypothetical protein